MLVGEVKQRESSIVFYIPGRIRFKIPQLYKNPHLAESLQPWIERPGINRIELNIYSMSFLIEYEPWTMDAETLAEELERYLQGYTVAQFQEQELRQLAASTVESSLPLPVNDGEAASTSADSPGEWHQMSIPQIIAMLQTDVKHGLTHEQAETLLHQIGLNEFAGKKKIPFLVRFLSQFDGFLIKLLLGASGVSIFLGQWGDALTILAIITVEAMLGVWQSYKAEKSLEALKDYTSVRAKVVRNGTLQQIAAKHLVPGDLVCLEAGDIIPADARLIDSANLEVNEASLTGESLPVEKSHKIQYTHPVLLADQKNMVFMGTSVAKGTSKAVIVQTGMNTELGAIAKMINESEPALTPLQQDLNRLARVITKICLGICGGIIVSGLLGGTPFLEMLRTGVSLAIGAIPEGLTSVLTISLAFGVQRMAKKGAIVKELPATEILSCADVICTDKTGTLTTGQMTVTDLYTLHRPYRVSGKGYSTRGRFYARNSTVNPLDHPDLQKIITTGALCNNTTYSTGRLGSLEIVGDPTEGALWVLAAKANLHVEDFHCYTREKEIAFDSESKKMVVICKGPEEQYSVHMKGDPNIVLQHCTRIQDGHLIREITPEHLEAINAAIDEMTARALRVIGLAYKERIDHIPGEADVETDLIFAGLAGMMDPPRPEVKSAVKKCHRAGIRLVMITGDHKNTAEAIGRQIHLFDQGGTVITGDELDRLSDEELTEQIEDISIFARTSPHQKLRIVKALKHKGHIVVMTGDGVNDAPAIKEANIGIAMGRNGTDVTLQSSSIILTDDNFSTIVSAIEEGRGISGNIRRFMRFVLAGNIGEVLAIFVASLLRLPTPLIPGQILMVNLITEGIPALSLGVDTPDKDSMNEPPRDAKKSIFDHNLLNRTVSRGFMMGASTFGIYAGTLLCTRNLSKARTLAYANLVACQMFHVFDCRKVALSENRYIVPAVILSTGLLLATIYVQPLSSLFSTCVIGLWDWAVILFMSSFIGRLDYIKDKANQLVSAGRRPRITYGVE